MSNGKLWLIGTGRMARFYAAVLQAMNLDVIVVGRDPGRAADFEAETGLPTVSGGLQAAIIKYAVPEYVIVATGVETLEENVRDLINAGVKNILAEKPGGLYPSGIRTLGTLAQAKNARVRLGFNRRFFASTLKAKEIIAEDGGVEHLFFDFSEMGDIISKRRKAPGVREHWLLANSSHVIDMAFFLATPPIQLSACQSGELSWHPTGSKFTGSGCCEQGALFSYRSVWMAPGGWSIEIITPRRRLLMQPLETLRESQGGQENPVRLCDNLDKEFKPGVYRQVEDFLNNIDTTLCSLQDQINMLDTYCKIAGYSK